VVGWGWYYLVTVMDDYSRMILSWELKPDMAAGSLIDVVQGAVDATGMTDVPLEDRTKLLSDNGPGYLSGQFNGYLRLVGIRHIVASSTTTTSGTTRASAMSRHMMSTLVGARRY
jgi:transposase InsO family protein